LIIWQKNEKSFFAVFPTLSGIQEINELKVFLLFGEDYHLYFLSCHYFQFVPLVPLILFLVSQADSTTSSVPVRFRPATSMANKIPSSFPGPFLPFNPRLLPANARPDRSIGRSVASLSALR